MKSSTRAGLLLLALVAVGLLVGGLASEGNARPGPAMVIPKLLEWDVMVGVPRPYTGATNPIRGVPGGGLPWVVEAARGELSIDGKLEIQVRGLVLAEGGNAGRNPQANFRAIVSCLSFREEAGERIPITVNVVTDPFPATPEGDADIEAFLALPEPCIAPIVFVTNAAGTSWFAATGF